MDDSGVFAINSPALTYCHHASDLSASLQSSRFYESSEEGDAFLDDTLYVPEALSDVAGSKTTPARQNLPACVPNPAYLVQTRSPVALSVSSSHRVPCSPSQYETRAVHVSKSSTASYTALEDRKVDSGISVSSVSNTSSLKSNSNNSACEKVTIRPFQPLRYTKYRNGLGSTNVDTSTVQKPNGGTYEDDSQRRGRSNCTLAHESIIPGSCRPTDPIDATEGIAWSAVDYDTDPDVSGDGFSTSDRRQPGRFSFRACTRRLKQFLKLPDRRRKPLHCSSPLPSPEQTVGDSFYRHLSSSKSTLTPSGAFDRGSAGRSSTDAPKVDADRSSLARHVRRGRSRSLTESGGNTFEMESLRHRSHNNINCSRAAVEGEDTSFEDLDNATGLVHSEYFAPTPAVGLGRPPPFAAATDDNRAEAVGSTGLPPYEAVTNDCGTDVDPVVLHKDMEDDTVLVSVAKEMYKLGYVNGLSCGRSQARKLASLHISVIKKLLSNQATVVSSSPAAAESAVLQDSSLTNVDRCSFVTLTPKNLTVESRVAKVIRGNLPRPQFLTSR